MSKDMPTLLVPDQRREGVWPQSLKISPVIEDWLDGDYKDTFEKHWKAFGSRETLEAPKKAPIPQVTTSVMANSDLFASYGEVAIGLRTAYDGLETEDEKVAKFVKDAGKHGDEFQDKFKTLIDTLSVSASEPPKGDMTEDEHIMTYVTEGLNAGTELMTKTYDTLNKDGDDVKGATDDVKKLTEQVKTLTGQNKDLQAQVKSLQQQLAGGGAGGGGGGGTAYDPDLLGQQGADDGFTPLDFGLDNGAGTGQDGTGGSLTDGLSGGSNSASDPSGLGTGSSDGTLPSSSSVTPASLSSPDSGMGAGLGSSMGGMGDMMSQMLPMLAQMQMMRQMQDQGLNGRNGGMQPMYPQQPVAPVQPASTTPQQTQPAASAASAQSDTAPKGASSSQSQQAGAVPPGRTPGADGTVEYPFPDGRTQKVSLVVAQALDAAFGNQGSTDAVKAYEKTSVKWSGDKDSGDHVDPNQMMTGDVGVWEKVTALLAVFGSGTDGTIEAIIDGNLQKLDSDKMDTLSGKAGEFGAFTEFQHPRGIEATAPDHHADNGPGMPMPQDQSGGVMSAAVGTPT
ncbi:hypothetical protein [Nocardia spumae]|uniref:hypothetical protein n=1 Tax=Nocardia spumae TaxID=2887190 RepID=UPI001D156F73|nr:hypothetical protein [Nocardia spumae]